MNAGGSEMRAQIETALYNYARGVDRKDWDLVRSVYHDGAIDRHGDFQGDADMFVAYLRQRHEGIEQSIHFISNILIEPIGPDRALVESYYYCLQRLANSRSAEKAFGKVLVSDGETLQLIVSGRYIDEFALRDSRWAIARRTVTFDTMDAVATPLGGGLDPNLPLSRRDAEDLLHLERRRIEESLRGGA